MRPDSEHGIAVAVGVELGVSVGGGVSVGVSVCVANGVLDGAGSVVGGRVDVGTTAVVISVGWRIAAVSSGCVAPQPTINKIIMRRRKIE